MHIFQLLFLVLLTSTEVCSKGQHLTGDEDIFEDALLEHLRDIRDENEEDNDVYYSDEDDYEEEGKELTKKELLQVLDVIKKEAHKRREKLKKSIEKRHDQQDRAETKKNSVIGSKKSQFKDIVKKSRTKLKDNINRKKETNDNNKNDFINIEKNQNEYKEKKRENNQVASVVLDNSLEKENELIKKINLRDILEKDGSKAVTNAPLPSHGHVKQDKVVSTKTNNTGLDQVSFIAVIAGCCVAAIAGLALAAYCWYKLRVENKDDTENPKPVKKQSKKKNDPKDEKSMSKDEEMNVDAEYYNYQHAKNQIKQMAPPKASDKNAGDETTDDEEEDEDTVYECPGLAAPGDMKVVNPIFSDGESRHSDKTSHDGSPTPPNERIDSVAPLNNNIP